MSDTSLLKNCPLLQPLQSPILRCIFLNNVFDIQLSSAETQAEDNAFDSFFHRYGMLCKLAANKTRDVEVATHWQLLDIIQILKRSDQKRGEIITIIQSEKNGVGKELADTLLDLAAALWSMLAIGHFPGDISYDEPIEWENGCLFRSSPAKYSILKNHFSSKSVSKDVVKLTQTFTAAHLEKIGGIEIRWTDNLADHLLLRDDDTKVMLFHQVSVLRLHERSPTSLLPKALIDETIRSISLLLPPVLGEPNPWFLKECLKSRLDAQAGICDRLNSSERQINRFSYWRDRLVLLKRTFDEAEPRNISQLWWDDRKKTQWFTFWVAVLVFVLTLFFGVIQSVAAIVQAWASVQALHPSK